jgi:hypothetical protein
MRRAGQGPLRAVEVADGAGVLLGVEDGVLPGVLDGVRVRVGEGVLVAVGVWAGSGESVAVAVLVGVGVGRADQGAPGDGTPADQSPAPSVSLFAGSRDRDCPSGKSGQGGFNPLASEPKLIASTTAPPASTSMTASPELLRPLPMGPSRLTSRPENPGLAARKSAWLEATTRNWPGGIAAAGKASLLELSLMAQPDRLAETLVGLKSSTNSEPGSTEVGSYSTSLMTRWVAVVP